MKRKRALVKGAGVAGLTCAYLLGTRGWNVDCAVSPATAGPVVTINRLTADLLLQLWNADETLFEGAHWLRGRLVQWERGAPPTPSEMPALVTSVDVLAARLADCARKAGLRFVAFEHVDAQRYDWVVQAGGRNTTSEESITFGRRRGVASRVKLTPGAHTDRAVMESVPGGWLFAIPVGLGRGALQAIFADQTVDASAGLDALLTQSRVMSGLIEELVGEPVGFHAMPRLAVAPCALGSIAVGDAAMAFDPLSGNGIGGGLRTAILAAAVLEAAEQDTMSQACFEHYTQRLRDTMRGHVRRCVDLYGRAAYATGWRDEINAMIEAVHRLPSPSVVPAFTLNHGRLESVSGTTVPAKVADAS